MTRSAFASPLAAVATALTLRLAALAAFYVRSGGRWETWEYEVVAHNLLAGKGFIFQSFGTAYRSALVPVFPVLCAALHWVGGPGLWLYFCVQLALSAAFIMAVYALGDALLGTRAGLWAAFLAAVEPGLVVYQSYKVDVALLTMTLMLLSFLGLLRAVRRDSPRSALWAGAVGGIAALTRPDAVALLALPPLAFFLLGPKRTSGRPPLAFALAFALVVLPWFVRGYRIHHRFLITSGSAQLLWAGNNPRSTGTSWTREGTPMFKALPEELAAKLAGAGEISNHDAFREAALAHIKGDPAAAVLRWTRTFAYFWTFAPDYSARHYYRFVPAPLFLGYRLLFPAIVLAAIAGTFRALQAGLRECLLLWAPPFCLALIHALHYVEGRHRLLALPFLLILVGQAAARVFPAPPEDSLKSR